MVFLLVSLSSVWGASLASDACPANTVDMFLCRDGTTCDYLTHPKAFGCCENHGGKLQCPSSLPFMCSGIDGAEHGCGDDHCCFRIPQMCYHPTVDRELLQDCPTLINATETDICPYNHGPQQIHPEITQTLGSREFFFAFRASGVMEIQEDGKLRPGVEWPFCPAHDEATKLLCMSGNTCDVLTHPLKWACCSAEGGRHRCPAEKPVMCVDSHCGGTENINGTEPCCGPSAESCSLGPASTCPGANSTTEMETRQCRVFSPVMCSDNSCVRMKSACPDGVQKDCPDVPSCEADGEWETTSVGGTAFAPCGDDANGSREGRKYRACISTFVDGKEVPQWGPVVDGESVCRPEPTKCPATVTDLGAVPYLAVDTAYIVHNAKCPTGEEGVTLYGCVLDSENKTTHDVVEMCIPQCTREAFCGGNGDGTLAVEIGQFNHGVCYCMCDAGWGGARCSIPVARKGRMFLGFTMFTLMVLLVVAILVTSCVVVCLTMKRLLNKGNKEPRMPPSEDLVVDDSDSEDDNTNAQRPDEKDPAVEV